ncbi:MAG: shikimate kinase [Clostridia bacterium]|nr:shikimate kinase [Clostridia bacterium]
MRKHLFLIGMMGCGKSTMAAALAQLTGTPCLDLDEAIVRREGRSIPEIFAGGGDDAFRICETAALRAACAMPPRIIATGGGIITRPENIALMRETGLVVWLCRPLESIIAGVRQDTRPNLAGDKEERMRTLYARREALYRGAAHLLYDNSLPPQQAAKALLALPDVQALL